MSETLKDVRAPDKGKTLVIERGGKPVFSGLEERDQFKIEGCRYGMGCLAGEGVNCSEVNTCYRITCTMCKEGGNEVERVVPAGVRQARWVGGRRIPGGGKTRVYIGQSGRTLHSRSLEHQAGLRRGDQKSALHKHIMTEHREGDRPSFVMEVLSRHRTNLSRMISEGIAIEKVRSESPEGLLNSRAEWGRTKLIRQSANINLY